MKTKEEITNFLKDLYALSAKYGIEINPHGPMALDDSEGNTVAAQVEIYNNAGLIVFSDENNENETEITIDGDFKEDVA